MVVVGVRDSQALATASVTRDDAEAVGLPASADVRDADAVADKDARDCCDVVEVPLTVRGAVAVTDSAPDAVGDAQWVTYAVTDALGLVPTVDVAVIVPVAVRTELPVKRDVRVADAVLRADREALGDVDADGLGEVLCETRADDDDEPDAEVLLDVVDDTESLVDDDAERDERAERVAVWVALDGNAVDDCDAPPLELDIAETDAAAEELRVCAASVAVAHAETDGDREKDGELDAETLLLWSADVDGA